MQLDQVNVKQKNNNTAHNAGIVEEIRQKTGARRRHEEPSADTQRIWETLKRLPARSANRNAVIQTVRQHPQAWGGEGSRGRPLIEKWWAECRPDGDPEAHNTLQADCDFAETQCKDEPLTTGQLVKELIR